MASTNIKQAKRWINVDSPLGEDTLIPTYFEGDEAISRLFAYRLELVSNMTSIAPETILGKDITIHLRRPDGKTRLFHGRIIRFASGPMWSHGYRHYQAEVVPWLWFLTRTTDCRIFEDEKVPDIIEKIFSDLGFSDFDLSNVDKGKHPKREYCVQYRETDFNFVSRLMEEEGMFYFFKHQQGKHTMVIADKTSGYLDCEDKEVKFWAHQDESNAITRWQRGHSYKPGKWAQRDYNFETPSDKLNTNKNTLLNIPQSQKYEMYDYPGLYVKKGDGDNVTTWRMEAEEAGFEIVEGGSDCQPFSPGYKFTMQKHECGDEEGKSWVILSTHHVATDYTHIAGEGPTPEYRNTFTCMPDSRLFRPERTTPKPVVHGPHTAFVTGPSGEEIHTDKYARIRAKFHWEREGHDSCWMRVSQSWAGKQWGTQFIPRVGMEVIVEFLEGDPDRPIVVGCVYNADYMPPYALTGNKTQSGWKTRSSTGGGSSDFNELRFEDKKGSEEVYFHAEKDFTRVVENNDSLKVGMDKMSPGKQDIQIFGNRTTDIETGNDNLTVKMGNKTTNVTLGSITYTALQSITLQVGPSSISITPASITLTSPAISLMATGAITQTAGGVFAATATGAMTLTGMGAATLTAPTAPCVVHGLPLIIG
ncbi:MAG TPA: type VI secretion system tip protein TssI/VgrG [Candidatus Acidoferrum sp.]|nr:type VI secretion system tip protein TssI/VgrG [Candidatus Acidoferrum sp.]